MMRGVSVAVCLIAILRTPGVTRAQSSSPTIPLTPGLTIVLAVHTPLDPKGMTGVAQGDYEMAVTVTAVDESGILERTRIEALDEQRRELHLTITRRVLRADLADSRLQILGFHTEDPEAIAGTTSLGPSLAVVRDLRTTGRAAYSVRNFRTMATSSGTLMRSGERSATFPVLVNGRRVELPALRATGQLAYDGKVRPWEHVILDHPLHPITLRFAFGKVGDALPFTPEGAREVVRIDFPVTGDHAIEESLSVACRVEVPGIYFDFNRATLNPQSSGALQAIADLLRRQPQWRLTIEGHTDNVGGDAYNRDLSSRRAAAVMSALVRDFAIAPERLTPAGFGARRPVASNETIFGRARNRRVELVRPCASRG
jgi:outer membrane protein OmpA-like peptidoglycan-associated protein